MPTAETLFEAALKLTEEERASLIERLLTCDRPRLEPGVEAELLRRAADYRAGSVVPIP